MTRVVNVHLSALPHAQTDLYHRLWVRITTWRSRCCGELEKYNYKCYVHRVTRIEAAYIRRTMALMLRFESLSFEFDDGSFKGKYRRSTRVVLVQETKKQIWATQMDICVFFYGCDPRPLLVCVGGCAYAPTNKDKYCECWCVMTEVKPGGCVCGCPGAEARTACNGHDDLLMQLTRVVGFLNQVQLQCHPNGTAGTCDTDQKSTCNTGQQAAGSFSSSSVSSSTTTACQGQQTGSSSGNTCSSTAGGVGSCGSSSTVGSSTAKCCTYTVHEYNKQEVKVKVECCPVSNGKTGSSCYKRLTHRPIGMCNGGDGSSSTNGFRLGDVYHGNCRLDYYCGGSEGQTGSVQHCGGAASGSTCPPNGVGGHCLHNGGSENGGCSGGGNVSCSRSSSDASTVSQENKWRPLVGVSVYYYTADTSYCDPLLVELTFKNVKCNGVQNGVKEYYRLTCDEPGGLVWKKIDNGCKTLENLECLVKYLDWIRYCLKKVVRIHLECKGTNGAQGAGNGYPLMGRKASGGGGQFCDPIKNGANTNGNGKVQVCESKCESLTSKNYRCFRHCLNKALSGKHRQVAGLVFTLPCTSPGSGSGNGACRTNGATSGTNGFVEIPVCIVGERDCDGRKSEGACASVTPAEGLCPPVPPGDATCPAAPPTTAGKCQPTSVSCPPGQTGPSDGFTIPPVLYNKCMGDVYVYFYFCKSGGAESCTVGTDRTVSGSSSSSCSPKNGGNDGTDTVPLMVRFNGHFYKPCSRDFYFTKWVCVYDLCKKQGECKCVCCCCGANADGGSSCNTGKDGAECTDGCGTDCACCATLVQQLNAVNESLNRIDLDKSSLANCSSATSNGSTKGYGLPEKCKDGGVRGCKLASSVGNDRIKVVRQIVPKPPPCSSSTNEIYTRIVHRTKNGFKIGDITYCCKDITKEGVNLNLLKNGACTPGSLGVGQPCTINTGVGQTSAACPAAGSSPGNGQNCTIRVSSNHKSLVNTCGWNTVVVYYSCSDKCMWLPQLIVLLKTDCPVKNGQAVTAGNGNKKYGYYVLAAKKNGGGSGGGAGGGTCASEGGGGSGSVGTSYEYQYRWVDVNGKEPQSEVKLDDETDFRLLNSAVILLNWTYIPMGGSCICLPYGGSQLQQAIKIAARNGSLKVSPGTSDQVNRLQHKNITVKDETKCTGSGSVSGVCPCDIALKCKCLHNTCFKVMTHDLTQLVTLGNGFKSPLCEVRLITGLKFLIPTRSKLVYKQVKLVDNAGAGGGNGSTCNIKYHKKGQDKICVYFYGDDPRPLMVSYDGWAYRATSMTDYDDQKWTQCTEAAKCNCADPPDGTCYKCKLLEALVATSNVLNPVRIDLTPQSPEVRRSIRDPSRYYYVHSFNGKPILIKVEAQQATDKFCYNRFTHSHAGVKGDGKGFRLGNIHYGNGTGKDSCIKLKTDGGNSGANNCTDAATGNAAASNCISASDVDDKNKCSVSTEVVVFYYKGDKDNQHPLLVALKSPEEAQNGKDTNYKPYFELTGKVDKGQQKEYKKCCKELNLSDTKTLEQTLDTILFKISKKLRIVLATRPASIRYAPSGEYHKEAEQLKQRREVKKYILDRMAASVDEAATTTATTRRFTADPSALKSSLTHHVVRKREYQAQLLNSDGCTPETQNGTKETKITVEEVDCHELYSQGGYRCFRQVLTTAHHIADVGGLVLCLWAEGKEGGPGCNGGKASGGGGQGLQLCENSTGTNGSACPANGSTPLQPVQLSYTTCKGDLYVFFYDEDPRPLLLCYNGEAYRPVCMADYCSKWVKVNNGSTKCVVNGNVVQADPQILQALYRVSMFLNPVSLVLCNTDYQKLDPKHGQSDGAAQGQQQQNGSSGPNGHQQPEQNKHHSYTIHRESRAPICIKVTGRDLRCYREYVHAPAKQGFRLGYVTYTRVPAASTTCSPSSTTDGSSSCPSTASTLATSCRSTPTTTPTTTSPGNNGFCFYYDCKKQLQTVSLYYYMYDKCHNWPLVAVLSYKGQSSEFYRLCCPGLTADGAGDDGGGQGACQGSGVAGGDNSNGQKCSMKKVDPRCLKWVKMGAESSGKGGSGKDSCGNDTGGAASTGANGVQDQCAPCPANSGASGDADSTRAESADMCQEDAKFVQRASEIHDAIYSAQSPLSVLTEDRLPLTRELSDLIEGRAFQIRKSLQIDYGEKTQERLILYTSAHCWEGWPLGYLVSGGALSVAAGGSWKFIVMAVGVFVKL